MFPAWLGRWRNVYVWAPSEWVHRLGLLGEHGQPLTGGSGLGDPGGSPQCLSWSWGSSLGALGLDFEFSPHRRPEPGRGVRRAPNQLPFTVQRWGGSTGRKQWSANCGSRPACASLLTPELADRRFTATRPERARRPLGGAVTPLTRRPLHPQERPATPRPEDLSPPAVRLEGTELRKLLFFF